MTGKRFKIKLSDMGELMDCETKNLLAVHSIARELIPLCDLLNSLNDENKELKKELKIYRKVASCSNCKYHNYDWDINDGYGGEEYEVCDKGNDVTEGICEDWGEL